MLQPKVSRHFERVDSTNAALLRDLAGPRPPRSGSAYTADYQTAGRGQGRAGWHGSPGDNLALSLYLKPDRLSVDRIFALTAVTALAVHASVASCVPAHCSVRIKWPNDIYVGDRKIAGILIQNGLRGSRVTSSVIGVGLNVNERRFPTELRPTATSLLRECGTTRSVDSVTRSLLEAFARLFPLLSPRRWEELLERYHDRLYRYREEHAYQRSANGARFRARLDGVAPDGRLRLSQPEGATELFANKEVRFIV